MGMLYQVENRWGGSSQPWRQGGKWIIGSRPEQDVVGLNLKSEDGGQNLKGSLTYAGEGPIDFRGELKEANNYTVQVRWGGQSGEWRDSGYMLLGYREGQNVVAIDVKSDDGGATLTGAMTYKGEGAIGFRSEQASGGAYPVKVRWGGQSADWREPGIWALGNRDVKNVVALKLSSKDDGETLKGSTTYSGEGPIDFKASRKGENNYKVKVRWGGSSGERHDDGLWVIGNREKKNIVDVDIKSDDGGEKLKGPITYQEEGPIDFKAKLKDGEGPSGRR